MKNNITITEHGYLVLNKNISKSEIENIEDNKKFLSSFIDEKSFEVLKDFNYKNKDEIFHLTRYKFNGETYDALKAKSFVGVIELKNGVFIEILPKIYIKNEKDDNDKNDNKKNIKKIFLKMLSKLRDSRFKEFGSAHLLTKPYPLFEIFAILFIERVNSLVRRGLRGDYVNIKANVGFLKGKLLFNEHIKRNLVHKEKFFVSFDEFNINTHANRIIKSTIAYLLKKRFSLKTQSRLRQLLFVFDEIDESKNIESDFIKAKEKMRLFKDYESVLELCKVFLGKESFTNYKGKELANAILFPMEKIFEDYVAFLFKKYHPGKYEVRIQPKSEYLFEKAPKRFNLKPDIILEKEKERIIIDTKWKLLDESKEKENYNISQSDLYQMYVYAKKYGAKKVILIYPENENFKEDFYDWLYEENDKGELNLNIFPFPLDEILNNSEENKNNKANKIKKILEHILHGKKNL